MFMVEIATDLAINFPAMEHKIRKISIYNVEAAAAAHTDWKMVSVTLFPCIPCYSQAEEETVVKKRRELNFLSRKSSDCSHTADRVSKGTGGRLD